VERSRLNYYIHDSADSFRLQLLGSLKSEDIKELESCWNTAKTTLAGRKVVVDITELQQSDEDGRKWLNSMLAEGASVIEPTKPAKVNSKSQTSTVKADSVRVTG
jgi:hypothetical protein